VGDTGRAGADGDQHARAGELFHALRALPPAQREAFLLHMEGELSLADIARVTGAGEETVKSRVRYATAKMREALEDLR
jgi:RNA polymerase sigma-70 factor (ECF subfamily)